jgi:hypothetical protein
VKSVRKRIARRATTPRTSKRDADADTFAKFFSHAGAIALAKIANREIKAAKARLRKLGIDPEDPPPNKDDPDRLT